MQWAAALQPCWIAVPASWLQARRDRQCRGNEYDSDIKGILKIVVVKKIVKIVGNIMGKTMGKIMGEIVGDILIKTVVKTGVKIAVRIGVESVWKLIALKGGL